jgi:hypothetical protein
MTMRTVTQSKEEESSEESYELDQRIRARKIIEELFPGHRAHFSFIEVVSERFVFTDGESVNETETQSAVADFKTKLPAVRAWAESAYGDTSPEACLSAYNVLSEETLLDKFAGIDDRFDDVEESVEKLRGKK